MHSSEVSLCGIDDAITTTTNCARLFRTIGGTYRAAHRSMVTTLGLSVSIIAFFTKV